MNNRILIAAIGLVASAGAWAQVCTESVNATAPTQRYVVSTDATVEDLYTGLIWQRCPLGYVLDDGGTDNVLVDDACVASGDTQVTWQSALLAAFDLDQSGASNWRVPDAKELFSIVEHRCLSPAINVEVFPAVDSGSPYWTSSATVFDRYVVDFNQGRLTSSFADPDTEVNPVRFVR